MQASHDIVEVAARLGMVRARSKKWSPCPACGYAGDRPALVIGRGWWCARCDQRGDVYDLVALVLHGQRIRENRSLFRTARAWCDGQEIVARPQVERMPSRVPEGELVAALAACTPATACDDADIAAFLRRRGLTGAVHAGVLPRGWSAPWWPYGDHVRLVVPAYNGHGQLRGWQGRDLRPSPAVKTRWPRGYDSAGLVFADPVAARALLRHSETVQPPRDLLIVEGLTDYLWAAQSAGPDLGVIGVASGSADALRLVRVPRSTSIIIGTHADAAGDRYAQAIADALSPRLCQRIPLHLEDNT